MPARSQRALLQTLTAVLQSVAWIVPVERRSEWSQEWQSELWYAVRECFSEACAGPPGIRRAIAFCMGSFQDALWLRRRAWQRERPVTGIRGSPWAMLSFLIAVLFSTWAIAHFSPRIATGMSSIRIDTWRASNVHAGPCDCALDWVARRRSLQTAQLFFDGFSHYAITRETVTVLAAPQTEWTVAHASPDVFAVLHLALRSFEPAGKVSDRRPQVILSQNAWIRSFAGNPNIGGAELRVGSVDAIVAGVASGRSQGLPGRPDAWLLRPDLRIGAARQAFIVGHLTSVGYFDEGRWVLSLGGILLAFLTLPFVNCFAADACSRDPHQPALAIRSQLSAFLIAKIAIITAIAWYTSVDLGCSLLQPISEFSEFLQCGSAFALCLTGLSWAFRDNRQRCPVCIRRVAHPVEVGQSSRMFLDWSGTELVCERGHMLLHIPAVSTSWFARRRWVSLDPSWQFLFPQTRRTSR